MTDKRLPNLWIVDADGTDHRPLTTGNYNDSSPRWSPDGKQLLYLSDRDGTAQIYRRCMDTGETARLTNLTEAPAGIAWSPDGKWISFAMHVPQPPRKIAEMPAPPEGAKWAEPARVIDARSTASTASATSSPATPISSSSPPRAERRGRSPAASSTTAARPAFARGGGVEPRRTAPDRRRSAPAGLGGRAARHRAVGVLGRRRRGEGADRAPRARQLARGFARRQADRLRRLRRPVPGLSGPPLYVMNRDGSGARAVTDDFDRDVAAPRWSPDGTAIWFLVRRAGQHRDLAHRSPRQGRACRRQRRQRHVGLRRRRRVHAREATAPSPSPTARPDVRATSPSVAPASGAQGVDRRQRRSVRRAHARRRRGDRVRVVEGRPRDPGLDHQAARLRRRRRSIRSSWRSTAVRSPTTATASTSKSS